MYFKNLVDIHNHTEHSFDAEFPVDEMCEAAIKKGLQTVAFTDHVEMDIYFKNNFDKTAIESFADVKRAKEDFKGRIEVLKGIELGEATYDIDESEKLLKTNDYDVVIGSIHNLRNTPDFSMLDYTKLDIDSLLKEYLFELKELAAWGNFDTMAHITYPLRYMTGEYGIAVDMEKYKKDIDEIFSLLIEKDKPVEINTSGFRQKIGTSMPNEPYIKSFRELGGKYVTFGSDAHTPKDIGSDIERGMELALNCGIKTMLIFRNRKPVEIPIE